jgi:hypothetical protein
MTRALALSRRVTGLPRFIWRDLPGLAGVLVQFPVSAGAWCADPMGAAGPGAAAGACSSVGPGVQDCGEGGEQLGHLDAEDDDVGELINGHAK